MTWVADNLTTAERTAYTAQLKAGYKARLKVQLLDIAMKDPVDLDQAIVDGEVQVDMDADISRSCSLTLDDASAKLTWGARGGSDYAIYPGRMVRVQHGAFVTSLGKWVDVPVFTGPITKFSRDQGEVTINASGKEWLLQAPFPQWFTMSWKKGANIFKVMNRVLEKKGETDTAFPKRLGYRLQRDLALPRPADTWPFLKYLAHLMGNRVIYYRGDGVLVLRPKQQGGTAWKFGDADILTMPVWDYDLTGMFNTVNIEFQQETKTKRHTQYLSPKSHPLSPETLARRNKPLVMASFISAQSVQNIAEARALGDQLLKEGTEVPVTLSFASLPIPFLEEGQRVSADIDGTRWSFFLKKFSFGLTPGGSMSININSDQLQPKKGKGKGGGKH